MTETPESQETSQEEKKTEVESLQEQLSDYKDKYMRQLAEMENMRKRLQKERQEMTQYAMSNLIADFLSPIDHMENALKHTENNSDEVKHWALGFKMILNQFKDVLTSNNVKEMDSMGKAFDPNNHEAIEMIETDEYPPGTIVEECLKGFKIGDKIIRPARVKVAKAPAKSE